MKREDFWYKPEAKAAGAIPTGTKAGQFLFLSAQTSVDLDTGKVIRDLVDLPPEARDTLTDVHLVNAYFGPVMAQTWTIYQNISQILAKQGAALRDIIRQRIFIRNTKDVGWMEKVMLAFFPAEKPATLILGVPDRGLHEEIRVWVEATALIPKKDGLQKEAIYLPELEKVTAPYPQAVKVGQFLFFEGLTGVDSETGYPIVTLKDLGPEADSIKKEGRYSNSASEAFKCQYWLAFNSHLRRLLESQGAGLEDLLVTEEFRRDGMTDGCERVYLQEKLFKTAQNAPSTFAFSDYSLNVMPDVKIVIGGVGLLPGEYKKESAVFSTVTDAVSIYSCVTKAGPFAHGGDVGYNVPKQASFVSFADLGDNGRFLAQSRIDSKHPIMTKSWHIYHKAFADAGVKADQVVHQTVYLKNPADWPAVENIARIVFGNHIPPTTVIPVDEIAFYYQYHMTVPESIGGEMVEMRFQYII